MRSSKTNGYPYIFTSQGGHSPETVFEITCQERIRLWDALVTQLNGQEILYNNKVKDASGDWFAKS